MKSPLSVRTYARLFTAQVIALAGTGLSTVALALLAYDLAGGDAGFVLGTALALKMVAYVVIAPIVGGFAHLLPRRGLLIALDIARAGTVICLPFVNEIWQIYTLIFLISACSAGFTPTFQATIPDILTDETQYTRALSLSRLAYELENLLSPSLAAAALLLLSYDSLFTFNALAFFGSALLVLSVRLPSPKPPERDKGIWENLSFGLRAYLRTPRLRGLLALSFAVAAAGAMVIVNTVVYVRDRFGGSESDTALALAAAGGGSMVVALILPHLLDGKGDRVFMIAGGLVLTLGLLLGLTEPGLIALLPVWFVLGAGSSLIQTPAGRLLRRSAHDADRAAIYAAQFALSHVCWLVAYPLAGWVGGNIGFSGAFSVLAVLALSATVIAACLWPRNDTEALEHVHEAFEHEHWHAHDDGHHGDHHDGGPATGPHRHVHRHGTVRHAHPYIIDGHHPVWPSG